MQLRSLCMSHGKTPSVTDEPIKNLSDKCKYFNQIAKEAERLREICRNGKNEIKMLKQFSICIHGVIISDQKSTWLYLHINL